MCIQRAAQIRDPVRALLRRALREDRAECARPCIQPCHAHSSLPDHRSIFYFVRHMALRRATNDTDPTCWQNMHASDPHSSNRRAPALKRPNLLKLPISRFFSPPGLAPGRLPPNVSLTRLPSLHDITCIKSATKGTKGKGSPRAWRLGAYFRVLKVADSGRAKLDVAVTRQLLGCAPAQFCLRSQNSSGLARGGPWTWLPFLPTHPRMDATGGMDGQLDG